MLYEVITDAELEKLQNEIDKQTETINETNISLVRELEKMERLNELSGKNSSSKNSLLNEMHEIENNLQNLYNSIEEITSSKGDIGEDQTKAQELIKEEQSKLNELGEDLDELQHQLNSLLIRDAADEKELSGVKKDIARLRTDSKTVVSDAQKKQSETQDSAQIIKSYNFV